MQGLLPVRLGLPIDPTADPTVAWGWLFEGWMVRVRWLVSATLLPSTLLSASFAPFVPWLVLGASNATLAITLNNVPRQERLHRVRYMGTAVDWTTGYLVFVLLADDSIVQLTCVVAILALQSGFRFGTAGLTGTFAVGLMTAIMTWYEDAFTGHEDLTRLELRMALDWALLNALAFVVGLAILKASHEWLMWDMMKEKSLELELDVFRSGLSPREIEILPLLARVELTYDDIGQELCVSPETIKTHVNRASTKLELRPKGRWMLVEEARRRHLIQ